MKKDTWQFDRVMESGISGRAVERTHTLVKQTIGPELESSEELIEWKTQPARTTYFGSFEGQPCVVEVQSKPSDPEDDTYNVQRIVYAENKATVDAVLGFAVEGERRRAVA